MQFAQSHVLPADGLHWTLGSSTTSLRLVGQRKALALVQLQQSDALNPVLEASLAGTVLGTVALNPPSALPPTEASGPAFATTLHGAVLPAAWVTPGVSLRVRAGNYTASAATLPAVGADASLDLRVLPFYLFGANETNTQPLSVTTTASARVRSELAQKWPIASLNLASHPAGSVRWDSLVIAPRTVSGVNNPAYRVTSMEQQQDGYGVMSAVLNILGRLRSANGDEATANQYYAPILAIDTSTGKYHDPSGGLGSVGGGTGVGDYRWAGVFFHEQGHAFGLPHAGDAYTAGTYPYAGGSLKGSAWGLDLDRNLFLDVRVPRTASSFASCKSSRQTDSTGACIKQDPMQGGSGDQANGDSYTMLSDFNAGVIQQWFEGSTTANADGSHSYSGGRLFTEATGYSRWDGLWNRRVSLPADTTSQSGLYGINQNLPATRNVPVQAIVIAYSLAGTPGASMIYPPIPFTGNLIAGMDPTVAADLAAINPSSGKFKWYCQPSGCDYSLRVTYADGSVLWRVLKDGFRSWFAPTTAPAASASDPASGSSFRTWAINVPATQAIRKIELLDTPTVWRGLPASPTVLLSR